MLYLEESSLFKFLMILYVTFFIAAKVSNIYFDVDVSCLHGYEFYLLCCFGLVPGELMTLSYVGFKNRFKMHCISRY